MDSNSSAAGPLLMEIPLPPGVSPEEWRHIHGRIVVIGIVTAVVIALAVWDYFILFRDEVKVYQHSSWRDLYRLPTTWAFIILRYATFLAIVPPIWFTLKDTRYCQFLVTVGQVGLVLVTASAGVIFYFRVAALWPESRLVKALAGFLYVLLVACWIAAATQFMATPGPKGSLLTLSNCQITPIPRWTAISYTSSVVFDIFVVVLTALKLTEVGAGQSSFSRLVYADSLFYFSLVSSANIIVLVIQAMPTDYQMLKPATVPFSTFITSALAQRVYLNLKLFNTHRDGQSTVEGTDNADEPLPRHKGTPFSTHIAFPSGGDLSPGYGNRSFASGF